MNRYRTHYPKDDTTGAEGDPGFIGVIARGAADALPPGYVRSAENITFEDAQNAKTARTRAGSRTPASFMHADLAGPLFGSGLWSDPNDVEWLLLAAADGIWRMRDGRTAHLVETPSAISARVEFVQAFQTMLVFRGETLTPWSWEGQILTPFAEISQVTGEDGTSPIPNGPSRPGLRPALQNNRLFVPHDRTGLAASEILDYTHYDAAFYDFNVTGGTDDQLSAIYPFRDASIICFNDQSIQLVSNLSSDLSQARLDPINGEIGLAAPGTPAMLGADILFLATTGLYRLQQVDQNRIESAAVPISDPIEPLMQRLSWPAAAGAVSAVHGRCYFLAVPIDRSPVNNAIFVYDSVSSAWQGLHTFPEGVQIDALHVTDYQGEKRLYAVDYANARVHLLYHSRYDVLGSTWYPIPTRLETRRYRFDLQRNKRFRRGRAIVRTWAPEYSVALSTEGVNETTALITDKTRDRTRYTIHGKPPYLPSNLNDDHALPDREDYSVDIGTPFDPDDAGIDFDLEQSETVPFPIHRTDRSASLIIANAEGTLTLAAVELEAVEADRAERSR